jgi:DNA-binding NtrC family response regulator
MVEQRRFREDLFYRLSVFPLTIPPLRDRRDDIPLLVGHFLERLRQRQPHRVEGIQPDALRLLLEYDWPGNVRQLENVVERAVLIEETTHLTAATIAGGLSEFAPASSESDPLLDLPYKEAMDLAAQHATREYLTGLLARTGGKVTQAANLAGIERESFHRLMRRCGLRAQDFRE